MSAIRGHAVEYGIGLNTGSPRFEDRIGPDAGAAYTLTKDGPVGDLTLRVLKQTLVAGEEDRVPLQLTNTANHRRILNITGGLLETPASEGWTFHTPSRILVGPGETTNVTVRVKPPAITGPPELSATARIRADDVEEPGAFAIYYPTFWATHPLDSSHDTFYLHSWVPNPSTGPKIATYGSPYLTRAATDSIATEEPVPFSSTINPAAMDGKTSKLITNPRWVGNAAYWTGEKATGQVALSLTTPLEGTLTIAAPPTPQGF